MKVCRLVNPKAVLPVILLNLGAMLAHGKRAVPKEVPPVTYQGIRYTAPHWGAVNGRKQNGQYVQAASAGTDKLLWELRIYEVKHHPKLESDVQDIFITSLKVVEGNLEVANEAGDKFVVDLSKRKVIKGGDRVDGNFDSIQSFKGGVVHARSAGIFEHPVLAPR
jgi:hypothetical protein